MCTSIVHNENKTVIGWNLDILNMNIEFHHARLLILRDKRSVTIDSAVTI